MLNLSESEFLKNFLLGYSDSLRRISASHIYSKMDIDDSNAGTPAGETVTDKMRTLRIGEQQGRPFNVLVIGANDSGKTEFIGNFYKSAFSIDYTGTSKSELGQPMWFEESSFDITFGEHTMELNITEVKNWDECGDGKGNDQRVQVVSQLIEERYQQYRASKGAGRDTRIHLMMLILRHDQSRDHKLGQGEINLLKLVSGYVNCFLGNVVHEDEEETIGKRTFRNNIMAAVRYNNVVVFNGDPVESWDNTDRITESRMQVENLNKILLEPLREVLKDQMTPVAAQVLEYVLEETTKVLKTAELRLLTEWQDDRIGRKP